MIAKTTSKKIGSMIRSVKYLFPEVALCLYKFRWIRTCMEYFCHAWAGASICYFEVAEKLQKPLYRTAGLSLVVPLHTF